MKLEVGKIYTCHCVGGDYFVFDYCGNGTYDNSDLLGTMDFEFLCSNLYDEYAISNSYLNINGREIKEPTEFELEYYKYMRNKYYTDKQLDYHNEISTDEYINIVKTIKRKIKLDKI